MMRICYVCPRYPPEIGGIETHVSEIASRLARRGCTVEVVAQRAGGTRSTEELDGVTVRRFPVPGSHQNRVLSLSLWRYLARRRRGWDLVHAHDYHALPALGAALAGARPLVLTAHYHGFGSSVRSRLVNAVYLPVGRLLFRRLDRVICVSEAEAALIRRHFPSARDRITVIPNGFTLARRADDGRAGVGDPLILCLGRLEPYKNVNLVVHALRHLPSDFKLRVIGGGSAHPELTDLVGREGLRERVDLPGRVGDDLVQKALSEGSALVTMSSREAFGLAPLEALASGLPVVASDIPAHRELRDRYGEGRMTLVPLDAAPGALAEVIRRAVATGRAVAPPDLPTWDRVADLTLGAYREVVG
jgi:glycosyltransferase involved in cell wall biosynthesis